MSSYSYRGVVVLALTGLLGGCAAEPASPADQAAEVERHLLSPCCYMEPLLTHSSPLATELRAEVARRIGAGERPAAVEAALVARYGERVRALPPGFALEPFGVLALALPVLGLVAGLLVWRSRRRRRAAAPGSGLALAPEPISAELDERLDDELAALD